MNKKNKINLPPGWRTVKANYTPKPGEKKTYSTDYGWIVIGSAETGKKEMPLREKEVKNG